MSLVIGLMLALLTLGGIGLSAIRDWKMGKNASLGLQAVYAAQRSYLADHPTTRIEDVPAADLVDYLPMGWSAMPSMEGLDGETLTLDHGIMPPAFLSGGAPYDPTARTNDSLWDVGE